MNLSFGYFLLSDEIMSEGVTSWGDYALDYVVMWD